MVVRTTTAVTYQSIVRDSAATDLTDSGSGNQTANRQEFHHAGLIESTLETFEDEAPW